MRGKAWILLAALSILACSMLGCRPQATAETPTGTQAAVATAAPTETAKPTPEIIYVEVTAVPPPLPTPAIIYVEVTPIPTQAPPATPTPPTPTPEPTATPQLIYIEVTPLPTPSLPATPTPKLLPTATPTPTPTPTPGPTPRFRTVERPDDAGYPGFRYESGPVINGDTISFRAAVEGDEELAPSQLQVWQSLRYDLDQDCSTARPIAFVGEGQGYGVTSYEWTFCPSLTATQQVYTDDVPWLTAAKWEVLHRSSNPFVYRWTVTVNLDHQRVRELMYEHGAEFVLVGFAGETLLARTWAE